LSRLKAVSYVSISFVPQANSGPELFEQLLYSPSAAREFQAVKSEIGQCRSFEVSLPQSPYPPFTASATLTPLALPTYGDESVAQLQTIKTLIKNPLICSGSTANLLIGSVLVRKGDYLILVALFPSACTFHVSQLSPYLRPALAKIP